MSATAAPAIRARKGDGTPLVMLTAYDTPSARIADEAGVVEHSVEPFGALYPQWATLERPALSLLNAEARQRWHERASALGREANATPRKAADAVVDAFLLPDEPQRAPERLARLRKAFFVKDEDRLSKNLQKFPAAEAAEAELQALCAAERQHTAWAHHQRMARLTRRFARKQGTFLRTFPGVAWHDVGPDEPPERTAERVLAYEAAASS